MDTPDTTYGVPPLGEGGWYSDDGDEILDGEGEHPTGTVTSSTQQCHRPPAPPLGAPAEKRRTLTIFEVEKAMLAQEKERNWIPELMERWRCTIPRCHLYGEAARLTFPGESRCRSTNTVTLRQWNDPVQGGEAQVVLAFSPTVEIKLKPDAKCLPAFCVNPYTTSSMNPLTSSPK